MKGDGSGFQIPLAALVAAAVVTRIAIEGFLPDPLTRHSHPIVMPWLRE